MVEKGGPCCRQIDSGSRGHFKSRGESKGASSSRHLLGRNPVQSCPPPAGSGHRRRNSLLPGYPGSRVLLGSPLVESLAVCPRRSIREPPAQHWRLTRLETLGISPQLDGSFSFLADRNV